MKIRLVKPRGRQTFKLRFEAESLDEGLDLEQVVGEMPKELATVEYTKDAILKLAKRGYHGGLTKETRYTREFTVRKAG